MRKIKAVFLILFFFLVSACGEEVELYEKEFQETSENWAANFYVAELPKHEDGVPMEEEFIFKDNEYSISE